jgi:ribosomal protein S18 acetylase RimI-like enzyme
MPPVDLDNPVWAALNDRHRHLAQGDEVVRWFPADIAPFIAVSSRAALGPAAPPDFPEAGYILGTHPQRLPDGWRVESESRVVQMLFDDDVIPSVDADGYRELQPTDRAEMYVLARQAFPAFFRTRTGELGNYVGVFESGALVAMAGERLAFGDYREISGVCTHPQHLGKGYARLLTVALMHRHKARGLRSFLHVTMGNSAAQHVYTKMKFKERAVLPMINIVRSP